MGAPPGSGARHGSEMGPCCEQRGQSSTRAVKRASTRGRNYRKVARRRRRESAEVHIRGSQRRASSASGGESLALENPTIHGCTCREPVAEVGEKHLFLDPSGEPRGPTEPGRGVADRGGSFLDEGSSSRPAKGCGAGARERNRERAPRPTDRKVGIEPMEGVLGAVSRRPKPMAERSAL